MPLSDLSVRQAKAKKKDRTLLDYDGLVLFVPVKGRKAWHFRYRWAGQAKKMSFGTYPEVSLREARAQRDDARALLAKGLNPASERKRRRHALIMEGEHTFMSVYERWRDHRKLSLDEGPRSSMDQMRRTFENDVFPVLRPLTVHEITRPHLLDIIGKVEKRGSLSMAEKLRTWFTQLFTYARVVVPGMNENPATDLDVVALPLPPVDHNPFLKLPQLPAMLQTLRKYHGRLQTQLGLRLLLLTGVRTGELRHAKPEQFDLERGLWIIPVAALKQRKQLAKISKRKRKRLTEIPPYIVPLSVQAMEIVRHFLNAVKPAQVYLLPNQNCLKRPISENTLNGALKRMGYEGLLTGHGIRATMSTALNEIGYPPKWVDAQLSHADPNRISATYNHAEYVEQRRVMMQDWADRLDLLEQNQIEAAGMHLTIHLQGLPTVAGQATAKPPQVNPAAPLLLVSSAGQDVSTVPPVTQRLSAVHMPDYAKPKPSELQRKRKELRDTFEAPHNLVVAEYAKLAGKSRRWITYEITAGNLLALRMGNRGQRVPVWHLDPVKNSLIRSLLKQDSPPEAWRLYYALSRPCELLDGFAPIDAVNPHNMKKVLAVVRALLDMYDATDFQFGEGPPENYEESAQFEPA